MTFNRMMSELDATKTQLAVFFVVLLLAVDSINPVKIFLHVFPQVKPWHIAAISILMMTYIFISEMKEILYFSVKVFFHSILSIFFREVQIVGLDNIPPHGPVIFTCNHRNQFIDGVSIFCTCQRIISYLVAEKSWNRLIVGNFAWAMGAVPVKRAQDSAVGGTGRVKLRRREDERVMPQVKESEKKEGDGTKPVIVVIGHETKFTSELNKGDKIRLSSSSLGFKVTRIENDETLYVDETDATRELSFQDDEFVPFDILKHVDQKVVYEKVLNKLAAGGTIGIFPEGGSHDRTDLLPLKVGVAFIAYSAFEKHGHSVPIVPVGLNYFRGHRFRGRLIVEYGTPIYIDPHTVSAYKKGGAEKRRVCNELLERIEDSMRSVLVTTPDYGTLELIYTSRRLYQRGELTASQRQDLNRRFAEGYKQFLLQTEGNLPEEWIDIRKRLVAYQKELHDLGIRDYQVTILGNQQRDLEADKVLRRMQLPYQILFILFVIVLALVPSVGLNLPVGLVARIWAEKRRKFALANSKVKIHGYDVMLSERVLISIVLVPTLWLVYGLILFFFTSLDGPSIALAVFSMPLFSYMGIMATEAGMISLRDLRPYVMHLFPSTRRRLNALPEIRKRLQADLRRLIKEFGPTLGELYYEKEVNWGLIQEKFRKKQNLEMDGAISSPTAADGKKDD